MSDADILRSFVFDALADLGATVSEDAPLVWVTFPEAIRSDLEVPATFALTFDPARSGEFEAELVAPGSYFLEKLVSLVSRRGRWDIVRCEAPPTDWVSLALVEAGLSREAEVAAQVQETGEAMLLLFSFRVTLVSDEKREAFHRIAVSPSTGAAWEVDPSRADSAGIPAELEDPPPNLESAYRTATEVLRKSSREVADRFRAANLRLLEEEVRRIFGYFDRTIEEIREADPDGSHDLLLAVQGERDRRLTETLERFDPKATASLCAVRAILAPMVRIRLGLPGSRSADVSVDAWSGRVNGLVCDLCQGTDGPWRPDLRGEIRCANCALTPAVSARPRARPRSGTPPRGKRVGRGPARSTRGSKGRSRSASASRRGP